LSRYNWEQERILVVTTEHFYLFNSGKVSRKHNLKGTIAIVKSLSSNEMVLVFPSDKDLRITGLQNKDEL
jgi:hypothetical protein